ncbi:hypothetical protein HEQ59_08525, partial [Haematospirillum jordaniae]|nr:hypothetical protein [Haematospirillum jordaniae]
MSLAVAVQMDPMESVSIDGDTTFALAECAQSRGHRLWHYQPRDLSFRDGVVTARARALTVRRERGNHFTLGPAEILDLSAVDPVVIRLAGSARSVALVGAQEEDSLFSIEDLLGGAGDDHLS